MSSNSKTYTQQDLRDEKLELLKKIREKQQNISLIAEEMLAPPKITTKMQAAMNGIESCIAVYDGVMFGKKAIEQIRRLFKTKKKS